MEAIEIISNIFGEDVVLLHQLLSVYDMPNKSRTAVYLRTISQWLEEALNNMKMETDEDIRFSDKREGRIGPSHVCFDIASHVGLFVLGSDRLSVNSQGNFSTIRANVCLYKGKWQYEVQLGSKGVMQIGWATNNCRFTQETGVGDTLHSYAYDGNRVRKWNVSTYKYGEPWLSGDVIGCTIDLDRGAVGFHRNGHTMGEAFSDVKLGPGMVYFPAVSLAFTENLVANFGSTPFRYPVEGYQPIQEVPHNDLDKANMLFKWLLQLLMVFEQSYENTTHNIEDMTSNQALLMGLAGVLIEPLAPLLLSSYIPEACLLPFLELLCGVPADYMQPEGNTREKKQKFLIFMDLLWAFLEEHEIKQCLESIASCLLACYRHVSFDLDYASQKRSLVMLTHLVSHPRTRHYLLENVLFDKVRFANFVHVKPMDEGGLAQVVTNPWWESDVIDEDVERNKEEYLQACRKIKEAAASVEAVQINFLGKLLDNADGTETQPSSRKIFLKKFRVFLHENLISSQTLPLLQTPLPVSLCCFHRLLVTFRILWNHEIGQGSVCIPSTIFYDGSINYFSIDRLGGVLSHLNKTLRADLARVLGEKHRVVASIPQVAPEQAGGTVAGRSSLPLQSRFSEGNSPFMIPALARLITHQQTVSGPALTDRMPVLFTREQESLNVSRGNGNANPKESLIELLDGLVLFYHLGAHKQIVKVSTLRENMSEYVVALNDTNFRLASYCSHLNEAASCSTEDDVVRELLNSRQVFETKLMEQARHMAWVRGAVYSPEKQGHLVWFLRIILKSLKQASEEGSLFSFVPDFYLETVIEVCTALRSYLHPTAPLEQIEGSEELLKDVAAFLCNHFADPRIVNAGSKDTLIQALASFVSHSHTLQCLELVPDISQVKMVKALLRPYENRAWAQSNWVLLRLWHGCGFAFRYQKSPHLIRKIGPKMLPSDTGLISQTMKPCPSTVFQGRLRNVMLSEEQISVAFLNSLLNQLNWVFSEFIGMLQEIQNLSNRPQRVYIESRQLKICATHFDLALSLLRVLEMVASVAREIFTNPESESSESLLSRLCQLLCQVLNRISSPAGCFQHVVILEIPDLETIDHFPILAAVIGILLALLEEDMINFSNDQGEAVPKVSKCLLSEPSFQMSSLHFVLGNAEKSRQKLDPKPFSFRNYPEAVTEEEISHVVYMIRMLETYQRRISEVKILSEDDLCTICYAFPISATFKPCNHQSCRSCIAHHLMNAKDCFFCKTPIQTVIGPDGQILHDCTTEVD